MDKEQHKDPLETLFRNQLDNPAGPPAEDGWDTPSEKVWAGISAGLPQAPRNGSVWRRGLILGFLLLVGFFMGFILDQNRRMGRRIREQNTQLEKLDRQVQALDSFFQVNKTLSHQRPVSANPAHQNGSYKNEPLKSQSENAAKGLQSIDNYGLTQKSINKGLTSGVDPEKGILIPGKNDPVVTVQNKTLDEIPGISEKSLEFLNPESFLNNEEPFSQSGNTDPLFPLEDSIAYLKIPDVFPVPGNFFKLKTAPDIEPVPDKIKFRIGPYYGISLTGSTLQYRTNSSNTPFFRDWEKADLSNEYGIKATLDIGPHWSVYSGFSRYGIQQISRQIFLIQFDPSREIATSGGELKSDYQLKAQSSLGESEVEIELRRKSGQPAPPNSTVRVAVGLRQKLDFHSIPLSVGYRWPAGPFELGLRGGGSVNFIGRHTLTATAQSQLQGIRSQSARVLRTFKTDRETVFDLLLGASLGYAPAKNWQIYLEPTYRANITPVARGIEFNTRTYAWSFHLGMNYSF